MSESDDIEFDPPRPKAKQVGKTGAGSPIYRYDEPPAEAEMAFGDGSLIEAIGEHIGRHLGRAEWVFHEIVSQTVHVDIHVVPPTDDRPFFTLVTSGMAERPMRQPEGVSGCEFAELCVCLPADWPGLGDAGRGPSPGDPNHPWRDERHYWPLRWLKVLARFPHDYQTWLWAMHTMPNGDPPRPFAPGTGLCGMMLVPNPLLPEAFEELRVGDREVRFWTLMPLHADEMQFKLDHGAEALLEAFAEAGVTPLIDNARPSVLARRPPTPPAKKPWWKLW